MDEIFGPKELGGRIKQSDQLVAFGPTMLNVHFLCSNARTLKHEGRCNAAALDVDVRGVDVVQFGGAVLPVVGHMQNLFQAPLDHILRNL